MEKLLRERNTLLESIALMAIMSAINAIASLLSYFLPIGGFILMLIIPLTSILVVLTCKGKYLPIYFFSSFIVSTLVTSFDIFSTILFTLPPLTIGMVYGIFYKLKIETKLNILFTSLINIGIVYFSLFILEKISSINMIDYLLGIFNISSNDFLSQLIPSFIFLYSICQVLIIHFSICVFGEKLNIKPIKKSSKPNLFAVISLFSILVAALFMWLEILELSSLLMFVSYYCSVFVSEEIIRSKNKYKIIIFSVLVLLSLILIPLTYTSLEENRKIFLFICVPCAITIAGLFKDSYTISAFQNKED